MLIVADDLTGAADAAGGFAIAGHACTLLLDANRARSASASSTSASTSSTSDSPGVLAVDTDSRTMSEADAFLATAAAVRAHGTGTLFVKIDSTLRGHVRATVDGALSAIDRRPSRIVVCPAFPALGRTVVDATVHLDGDPIDGGELRPIFSGFSGGGLFIPTVRTDGDLAALVAAMPEDVLWVGSAGVARHLAAVTPLDASAPSGPAGHVASRVVVVVGSQHDRTLAQLRQLGNDVEVCRVDPRDPANLDALASAIDVADGLVLTGGHTARVVLDRLRIRELRVGGEVEIGVPWSVATVAGRPVVVVTKAGGFGDEQSLRRAVDFLTTS